MDRIPLRRPLLAVGATALTLAATVAPWASAATPAVHVTSISGCSYGQLRVRAGGGGAGLGHVGFAIRFTNTSSRTCSLHGYPGAAGLNKHGKQVTQAKRTTSGYLGGLKPGHPIPTVVLKPGQTAASLIEGTDVPEGNATHCPTLHGLLVTPPNDRRSVHLTMAPPDCSRIQIHPVLRGTSGTQ
jgi:hypothetical protein